ncbi:hypothetical protein MES5069_360022 [Mesorhizobium escarrei]|uniref:Uncharacterized protein n=1 Tax=Mesorhizobium escarrei TaxID=666018 RepID=A0ABN8K027_9HYPH|nr:hypothetical protein MES5069_360022 [Mesorhizobium escarrei]
MRVDLVDRRQLEDQLNRQRPLVALDEIEVGRRDAEPFGHRRLGQALGAADAADARPGEDLLIGHSAVLDRLYMTPRGAAMPALYNHDRFTAHDCQTQHRFSLIFQPILWFSSPVSRQNVNAVTPKRRRYFHEAAFPSQQLSVGATND